MQKILREKGGRTVSELKPGADHSVGLGRVCLEVLGFPGKEIHTEPPSSATWEYGKERKEF